MTDPSSRPQKHPGTRAETHVGTHSGTRAETHVGTHSTTRAETHVGTHSGNDLDRPREDA